MADQAKVSDGKGGQYILQFNHILNDYKYLADKFFRIRMKAREINPVKIINKKNEIETVDGSDAARSTLFDMEVLYSGATFSTNHSHSWGSNSRGPLLSALGLTAGANLSNLELTSQEGSGIWEQLKTAYDVASGVAGDAINKGSKGNGVMNIAQLKESLQNSIKDDNGNLAKQIRNPNFSAVDLANAYEGSGAVSFNVTTTFIAYEDPVREVILPCKILESIGYPSYKAKDGKGFNHQIEQILKEAKLHKGGNVVYNDEVWNKISDHIFAMEDKLEKDFVAGADGIRFRAGSPPPVWEVQFSNGLHKLRDCALTNVSVNYYGPWLGKPNPITVNEALLRYTKGKSPSSTSMADLAGAIYTHGEELTADEIAGRSNRIGGYPSYAEVTLTFTNNYSVVFGEDILSSVGDALQNVKKVSTSS